MESRMLSPGGKGRSPSNQVVQLDAVLQALGQWQGSLCEPIDVRLGSAVVQQL